MTLPFVGALSCLVWTLRGNEVTHKDTDWLMMIEFGLPLMLRHRMIFEDRYSRFIGVVSLLSPYTSTKRHYFEKHLLVPIEKFVGLLNAKVSLEPCLED